MHTTNTGCNGCFWQDNCDGTLPCEHFYNEEVAEFISQIEYKNVLGFRRDNYHAVLTDAGWDANE